MSQIEYPKAPDTPVSHLPFSPAVRYGDFIFVSGQASVDHTGKIISGTFEEEFHRSMQNLIKILHDSGSDLQHVVRTCNYLQDPKDSPQYQELYRQYFKDPLPARTTLTGCLATVKYEIDCIAVVKKG